MFCGFEFCKNASDTTKDVEPDITYHRLPTDDDMKKKWIEAIGRAEIDIVCSAHFAPECFDDDLKTLKATGVPSLLLNMQDTKIEVSIEEVPIEEVPIEEVPIEGVPIEEIPIEEVPIEEVRIEEIPIEEVSMEEVSMEEVPIEEVLTEEVPTEEVPIEEVPTEEALIEEAAIEEGAAEEPPIDEAPIDLAPIEETTAIVVPFLMETEPATDFMATLRVQLEDKHFVDVNKLTADTTHSSIEDAVLDLHESDFDSDSKYNVKPKCKKLSKRDLKLMNKGCLKRLMETKHSDHNLSLLVAAVKKRNKNIKTLQQRLRRINRKVEELEQTVNEQEKTLTHYENIIAEYDEEMG